MADLRDPVRARDDEDVREDPAGARSLTSRASIELLVRDVVDGFARHRLLTYASAIAYQVVSSIIPFACFTLALLGLLNAESLWTDHLAPDIRGHTSTEVYALVDQTVTQVLERKELFWVTGGLALALWEVSGAMRATIEALDDIYGIRHHRSRTTRYAVSIALAAIVGALTIAGLVVTTIGSGIVGGGFALGAARYVVAALLLMLAVGFTLRLGPSARHPFRWVGVGSLTIVTGWLVVISGYVVYATRIASYDSIFGSLAVAFLLIVAIYLASVVFLVGALVDATVRGQRR